jgi:polyisoprenoid-binding protein YceI
MRMVNVLDRTSGQRKTSVQTRSRDRRFVGAPLAILMITYTAAANAAPVTYDIDPSHTHPSFEVDHYGMSMWRGLFRASHGTITLDRPGHLGTADIVIDVGSVDLGNDALNEVVAQSDAPPVLEVAKFPTAHFVGTLGAFVSDAPTTVTGILTLHGISKPLNLTITKFKCLPELPVVKREVCGADAIGEFDRSAFGITVGQRYGFDMKVTLRIQVEAIKQDAGPAH